MFLNVRIIKTETDFHSTRNPTPIYKAAIKYTNIEMSLTSIGYLNYLQTTKVDEGSVLT